MGQKEFQNTAWARIELATVKVAVEVPKKLDARIALAQKLRISNEPKAQKLVGLGQDET